MNQNQINSKIARFDERARLERLMPPEMIQKTKAIRHPLFKYFVVQSNATGDAVYNCKEAFLLDEWDDTTGTNKFHEWSAGPTTEVMNLGEFYPLQNDSRHMLLPNDILVAFSRIDLQQNPRWVGIPFLETNKDACRVAYCDEDAQDRDWIWARLDSPTGTQVTVYCNIVDGTKLDEAVPLLSDGDKILVRSVAGTYYCTGLFRKAPEQSVKIFEVQSEATGDGVYNCYEQILDATEWDDTAGDSKVDDLNTTSVEVLNLAEFDPESTYVAHLQQGDLIAAWKKTDDESNDRWVGLPLRKDNADRPRRAFCKNDAGSGNTIDCYLDIDGTGTEITVTFDIAQGGSNVNEAEPRLKDGDPITVYKDGNTWRCYTVLQPTEDCECYES